MVEVVAEFETPEGWRGFGWPDRVTVTWTDGPVAYHAEGTVDEHGLRLTRLTVVGDITAATLRYPVVSVFRAAVADAALAPRPDGGFSSSEGVRRRVPVARGRSRDLTAAANRLDEVRAIRARLPRSEAVRHVAEMFGVSRGYARRLIQVADEDARDDVV